MKKILAMILSFILILSFVGCNKDIANKKGASSEPGNSSVFTGDNSLKENNQSKDDTVNSGSSSNTTSGNTTPSSGITTENVKIDSLDKLNFYAVKQAIAENGTVLLSDSAHKPKVATLANSTSFRMLNLSNSTATNINANSTFTMTMYSYFTIMLNDTRGFLAQKLGGTGSVEVVITQNNFHNMITFKKGERYYSCLQISLTERAMSFSSHKYVNGFQLVENFDQENYKFTVSFEGDKVIGINCGRLDGNGHGAYVADDITFNDTLCFVIHKKQTFTAKQLEDMFASNNENSSDIKPSQNENNTTTSKPSHEPEPHKHVYTTNVVAPTCSKEGYTLHKCACGDEYLSNETPQTYRHRFSKNTHPNFGDSYVGNYLGSDTCSLCGLEVIDQGYWRDANYKKSNVRYYFTNDTFVVYGSGTIPGNPLTNSSKENLAPWNEYFRRNTEDFNNITTIIIADGITEISDNSFKFPEKENNIKTIYISDSVKKIKKSFSGFDKVTDVRLSHNLEYLGANFSSRDHGMLRNKTVLPKTLKYLSRSAFPRSDWLWYEGTEEEFSSIRIIENQSLTAIEWINNNREALIGMYGVDYNCTFQ